jgi:putative membrane fusion protein
MRLRLKEKSKKMKNTSSSQKKKIIIYIALIVFLFYIAYSIYLLVKQPTSTFTVEEGKLYQEETDIGYVIRNETVVKGENYKNGIMQIKSEGERAAKDENIFRYYSNNEETLKQKIADLDSKIQEVMLNDTSLFSSDMKLLENQIDEKVADINQITDSTKLAEYKKEISNLVTKKAQIAGDLSPKGSYLNQLIEERKSYESQLNSGAEYVTAPMSGIVSYKVDGLEEVLTPDNFNSLSKEYLESLDLKTGKIVATNEECGKVIDNFYCYIATISSSEEAKNAEVGQKVSVRLSNNSEISAEITNIIKDDEEDVVIILKIEKEIEELINYRKISFDLIWWDASGLKVPNQAIAQEDELDYVVRNRAGYLSKILVKVKKQGEKYSIVEPYDTEELKELGFSNKDIINYKKISIYDEILLNPNLDNLD